MTDNKIYDSWAYTADEIQKSKSNRKALDELNKKHKILSYSEFQKLLDKEKDSIEVVFGRSGSGYASTIYTIYKNEPQLTTLELALICDNGNLCFGYSLRGSDIAIYTD